MSSRPSRGAARLAAILDALPDALLLVNCNGTVVNANHIALETFETPGTALVGRGLLDLLPAFDSKRIPGGMRRPSDAEAARTRPTRMIARRTDGVPFPVEVTSANLEDGRTPYADHHSYTGDELLMLVVRDLTGTLDTEAELARQQRQTEMILRAAAEGVVGVDTEGKVVLVNPAAAQILGYRASDLGGQELHPLVHHSRPDGTPFPYEESPLADTLRSGRKHRVRGQTLWSKSGDQVPVDLTTAPVRDGDQLVGAVMTFTDRRAYDEMVAEQNERYDTMLAEQTERYDAMVAEQTERYDTMLAEQTERYASMLAEQTERGRVLEARHAEREGSLSARNAQLLAVLGESLRGPLLQLRAELGTLAADPAGQLWPEANQILHHLAAGYARMTTLVDNVLSFQSLEAGQDQLTRRPVTLDGVISAGVEGAVELIGPGRAQFAVHAPPIEAEVDPERLAQALAHLIADVAGVDSTGHAAGAATGDSTIVVAAAQRGEVVRIEVRGPYSGGHPVHEPIVQGVVRRHGGVLQTHQLPGGHGSAYVLEVPLTAVADAAADTAPGADSADRPGTAGAPADAAGGAAAAGSTDGAAAADASPGAAAPADGTDAAGDAGDAVAAEGSSGAGSSRAGFSGPGSSGAGDGAGVPAGSGAGAVRGSGAAAGYGAAADGRAAGPDRDSRPQPAGGADTAPAGRRARRHQTRAAGSDPVHGGTAGGPSGALTDGTAGGPGGVHADGTHDGADGALAHGTAGGPAGALADSTHGGPGGAFVHGAQGGVPTGAKGATGGARNGVHPGVPGAEQDGTASRPAGSTAGDARGAAAGRGDSGRTQGGGPGVATGPHGPGAQDGTDGRPAVVPPPTGRRRARRDPQEEQQAAGGDPQQAAGPQGSAAGPQPVPAAGVPVDAGYPAPTGRRARRAGAAPQGGAQPAEAAGVGRAAFALPPAASDSGQQPGGRPAEDMVDGAAGPQSVAPGTGRRRARRALPEATGQDAVEPPPRPHPQTAGGPDGGRAAFALPPAAADRAPQGALPAELAPAGLVPAQSAAGGAPEAVGGSHRQGDWAQHPGGPGTFPGAPQGVGPIRAHPPTAPGTPGDDRYPGQGPGDAAYPAPGAPGNAPRRAPAAPGTPPGDSRYPGENPGDGPNDGAYPAPGNAPRRALGSPGTPSGDDHYPDDDRGNGLGNAAYPPPGASGNAPRRALAAPGTPPGDNRYPGGPGDDRYPADDPSDDHYPGDDPRDAAYPAPGAPGNGPRPALAGPGANRGPGRPVGADPRSGQGPYAPVPAAGQPGAAGSRSHPGHPHAVRGDVGPDEWAGPAGGPVPPGGWPEAGRDGAPRTAPVPAQPARGESAQPALPAARGTADDLDYPPAAPNAQGRPLPVPPGEEPTGRRRARRALAEEGARRSLPEAGHPAEAPAQQAASVAASSAAGYPGTPGLPRQAVRTGPGGSPVPGAPQGAAPGTAMGPDASHGRAISVRTLGQGVAYAQQAGEPGPHTPAAGTPVPGAPPLPGSGRRRKLAARPEPAEDRGPAAGRRRPASPQPAQPPHAQLPGPSAAPGRAFAIGAPDEGAEGPEPLDGPNGAVEVVDDRTPPRDDELPPEPLDNPRRLLVWPAPDVSTQQALSDRGYRPVIVNSREEVDAQIAAYPAALFVDPLTGPITRTALQSLRTAAVAAEVPVLVTAGLGQATREAAYGADPAVLLKALAPRDSEQHPARVLLIEEQEAIAAALTGTLERRGMQVARAGADADAVALATQMRPNLVVMDLMQVRRRRAGIVDWLRGNGLLNRTPLVVYTSAGIDPGQLSRLASGETVLFLAERSTSADVQARIVDLLAKIGTN
ncbi:hypothetical protein ACZ90_05035 [Streptomyces albus subsp. albus]|nr:hypothetical protein ACZ90_05035 [Streptomyces albus subsp. albus]